MTEPAKLKIAYKDPKKLKGYERNARTHSPEQVAQIRASIDEFTFTNPILLKDDGVTIGAGHGRLAAAMLDPPLAQVPTITLVGLTEDQWRAYVIADNKLALNAGWDENLLRLELRDLRDSGVDLSLTGFSVGELEELRLDPPEPSPPPQAPGEFPEYHEGIVTTYECPKCQYKWSGKPHS